MGSSRLESFSKRYLTDKANSKEFLKSISYSVELGDLMKVVKSCSYHQSMDFCPVILELIPQRLQDYYCGSFLLQVYSKKDMIYQKVLKYDVISWNIFHDYLIFKLDRREQESEWIHIIHLSDECKVTKVKNFAPDQSYQYMGVNQGLFFYANSDFIKIVDIKKDFGGKNELEVAPTPEQILTHEIGQPNKFHGFFENGYSKNDTYIMCIVELDDNQIDYTRLYIWTRDDLFSAGNLEFFQYREVVPRISPNDRIVKHCQVVTTAEFQFGMALRASGKVDFYWNFTLTNSPDVFFTDIKINYDSLYLKNSTTNQTYQIKIKWDSRIGIEVADKFLFEEQYWNKIMYNRIRLHVCLYSAIALVHTTFFVSYGKIVSTFDIIKKLWVDHFIYDEEVTDLLRNSTDNYPNDYAVGVLLDSGKIKQLESKFVDNVEVWYQSTKPDLDIKGKTQFIVSDWRDMASHYILTTTGSKKQIWAYQNEVIKEITTDVSLKDDSILLRFLSDDPTKDFAIYSPSASTFSIFQSFYRKSEAQLAFSEEYKGDFSNVIQGTPHTAVITTNTNFFFVFDEKNIYILDIKAGKINVLKDFCIQGLQLSDRKMIYMLQNEVEGKERQSGLYLMNLENLVEKAQQNNSLIIKLKSAIVGKNNLIDYYMEDERIAYMSDFEQIKIVPILHRNVINFIGMKNRGEYLSFKRMNDKLIALDKNNILTTWNITTGKVEGQFNIKTAVVSSDFKIYSNDGSDFIYKADWYMPRLLLIDDVNAVENVDEVAYFGDRLKTSLQKNTAYTKIEQKTFRTFKLIEIINETSVVEHFSFIHPHYGYGSYQRIFFSDDLEYMLERLINQRCFLYRRAKGDLGTVTWHIVRRIKQFPMDLSECTYNNFLFSPNLMNYLDFDRNNGGFVIKRSLDQSILLQFGQNMDHVVNDDERKLIAQKFRWVNNNVMRIINNDGIEKLIDISSGQFKPVNSGTVPMLNIETFQGSLVHYYFKTQSYEQGDIYNRLVKKYQSFFSTFYVDNIREPLDLYNNLFDVDFGMNQYSGKPVIDLSFTYVHWKMSEMLKSSKQKGIKINRLNDEEVKILLLNIFPMGNTVLHYAYKNLNIIRKLFARVNQINNAIEEAKRKSLAFEIPFIQDFSGKSPLHLCIFNNNIKSANVLLENLQNTPLDSHSRAIYDILPKLVENKLTNFGPYLDFRFLQTKMLEEYRRGAILYKDDLEYSVSTSELWPDISQVEKSLLVKNPLDSEIKLQFLDMPSLHSYSDETSMKFFKQLADADIEMFEWKSIRAIIDYKWTLAQEYTLKLLFLPFVVYLITFSIYSNVFNGQHEYTNQHWKNADIALSVILYVLSLYFLFNEARQLMASGIDYLRSIWNYSDLLPPILVSIIVTLHLNIQYNEDYIGTTFMYTIHSMASALVWAKFIYFLRIFKLTGHLVRILTEVIYDMRVFLLILFIVYMAFGEAFLRISEASIEDGQFIPSYAYAFVYAFRLSIGDTNTDTFEFGVQPVTLWIIFMLSALLTNVVMLNLLIAIISESFGKIMENKDRANYQERARIIFENSYLIPNYRKKQLNDVGKLLIIAFEVVGEDDKEDQQEIQNKVDSINESLLTFKNEIMEKQKSIEDKLDTLINKK